MGIGSVIITLCFSYEVADGYAYHSFEIARAFVKVGARVIMVNRKEEQGEDAIKKIKDEVGPDAKIEWEGCDMGNLKEVKEVFTKIREREERLDLVSSLSKALRSARLTSEI
jgi:NAD(P)-dependent dehydrogenase (short-subunit alcohol dehydrogenase family)